MASKVSNWLLFFELSDLLNLLLILITLATVRYASKTLSMEYSSQILVSRYRKKFDRFYTWEVDIENKGRAYIVKAFILLTIKSKKPHKNDKQYYLSKPIVDIDPNEKDIIRLSLSKEEVTPHDIDQVGLEVYYQDALNHIYLVSPHEDETKEHLEKFEPLPRKISFLSPQYFLYRYKFKKAASQKNTFVHREM